MLLPIIQACTFNRRNRATHFSTKWYLYCVPTALCEKKDIFIFRCLTGESLSLHFHGAFDEGTNLCLKCPRQRSDRHSWNIPTVVRKLSKSSNCLGFSRALSSFTTGSRSCLGLEWQQSSSSSGWCLHYCLLKDNLAH